MTSLKRPGALYDRGRRFRGRFGEISVSRRASECAVTKAESLRLDFAKAVACLDEALTLPKDLIVRDSPVQPVYPDNPILYVTEVHEHLVPKPLAALRQVRAVRTRLYDIAGPAGPHGILLGTQRWQV